MSGSLKITIGSEFDATGAEKGVNAFIRGLSKKAVPITIDIDKRKQVAKDIQRQLDSVKNGIGKVIETDDDKIIDRHVSGIINDTRSRVGNELMSWYRSKGEEIKTVDEAVERFIRDATGNSKQASNAKAQLGIISDSNQGHAIREKTANQLFANISDSANQMGLDNVVNIINGYQGRIELATNGIIIEIQNAGTEMAQSVGELDTKVASAVSGSSGFEKAAQEIKDGGQEIVQASTEVASGIDAAGDKIESSVKDVADRVSGSMKEMSISAGSLGISDELNDEASKAKKAADIIEQTVGKIKAVYKDEDISSMSDKDIIQRFAKEHGFNKETYGMLGGAYEDAIRGSDISAIRFKDMISEKLGDIDASGLNYVAQGLDGVSDSAKKAGASVEQLGDDIKNVKQGGLLEQQTPKPTKKDDSTDSVIKDDADDTPVANIGEAAEKTNQLSDANKNAAASSDSVASGMRNAGKAAEETGNSVEELESDVNKAVSTFGKFADKKEAAKKAADDGEGFTNGLSYEDFFKTGVGTTQYSRNAVDGTEKIPLAAEVESRLDELSKYIGGTPELAGTAENVRTLFTKLNNLDVATAKINRDTAKTDIDTAVKHYNELNDDFKNVWEKYKVEMINADRLLAKEQHDLEGKIATGQSTDRDVSRLDAVKTEREKLAVGISQLETHLQQVLLESRRRIERFDAQFKDSVNKTELDNTVKDYKDAVKRIGEAQRDLIKADVGTPEFENATKRLESAILDRENAVQKIKELEKDGYSLSRKQKRDIDNADATQERLTSRAKSRQDTKNQVKAEKEAAKQDADALKSVTSKLDKSVDDYVDATKKIGQAQRDLLSADKGTAEFENATKRLEEAVAQRKKAIKEITKLTDEASEITGSRYSLSEEQQNKMFGATKGQQSETAKKVANIETKKQNDALAEYKRLLKDISKEETEIKTAKSEGERQSIQRIIDAKVGRLTQIEVEFDFNKSQLDEIKQEKRNLEAQGIVIDARIEASNIESNLKKLIKVNKEMDRLRKERIGKEGTKEYDAIQTIMMDLKQDAATLENALGLYDNKTHGVLNEEQWLRYSDASWKSTQKVEQAMDKHSDAVNKTDAELKKLKQSLLYNLDIFENKNTRAMGRSEYADEIARLRREADKCGDVDGIKRLKSDFDELNLKMKSNGLEGLGALDKLKNKFSEYATYAIASMGIMEVVYGLQTMAREVVAVDTAMTGLMRVTEMTGAQYDRIYDGMIASSKEYGRTLTDTINATADWVRAGFDADTALGLSEVTAMYQNVSDLDYDEASKNLLTSYKGFQDQLMSDYSGNTVEAVTHITDVLNELDNKFSVTSAGLGEGLARSASALQIAGNTFEESAGMIGAVAEVTQDPEKAGNAMKILSLRLRGMKGEVEEIEAGASEGMESISKMQTQILNMTGGRVNIFDENGDFKSTYDIMQGIVEVWDTLSSIDQAEVCLYVQKCA